MATTITGGVTAVSTSSAYATAVVQSDIVDSTKLDTNAMVYVTGSTVSGSAATASSSVSGAALIAQTSGAILLQGTSAANQLLVSNDDAGSSLQAGTGTGQTLIGGSVGQVLGTSSVSGGSALIVAGGGDDTVISAAGTNTILAGAGSNLVGVQGGSNTIVSSGNDTVIAAGGTNLINAGSGDSSIFLTGGANTVAGGSGNATIFGASANNQLMIGNTDTVGTAFLIGGAGDDMMMAGKATTVMQGNDGSDLFVFTTVYGGGKTVIADFKSGTDHLAFLGYTGVTAASIADSAVQVEGGTAIFMNNGSTILVAGVTSIKASDILVG